MTHFFARSNGIGLEFANDSQRWKFKKFLKENEGIRLKIEPVTPESRNQRAFFEGAVIPLVTFYQEGLDYRNSDDLAKVRDWLKLEFNGDLVEVGGKVHKIAKSTKGELNNGFLERIFDWMAENGYQVELLDPNGYKKWRDEIFPWEGGPDNYMDYLLELGKLRRV